MGVFGAILLAGLIAVVIGTLTSRRPPRRRNRANYWAGGTITYDDHKDTGGDADADERGIGS